MLMSGFWSSWFFVFFAFLFNLKKQHLTRGVATALISLARQSLVTTLILVLIVRRRNKRLSKKNESKICVLNSKEV